jgi:hypothetical protein
MTVVGSIANSVFEIANNKFIICGISSTNVNTLRILCVDITTGIAVNMTTTDIVF